MQDQFVWAYVDPSDLLEFVGYFYPKNRVRFHAIPKYRFFQGYKPRSRSDQLTLPLKFHRMPIVSSP